MAALISVFVAISLSLLVTRIATEALTLTGLSRTSARFQARSAFTGSGFTTQESEAVVQHPVRRRIVMWLMFLGNAGIITVVSSLVLTFVSTTSRGGAFRLLYLSLGLGVLWFLANNKAFNRLLTRLVRKALRRWTDLDLRDYASLLHLRGDYQVMEITVSDDDWLANKKLKELRLRDEGIAVLGIQRNNDSYLGAPFGDTYVCSGDTLILYGRKTALIELDMRTKGAAGEKAHQQAIATQQQIEQEQSDFDTYSAKREHIVDRHGK